MNDPALRVKIEAAIERLVAVLDAMDAADEDREPQGDEEPSFAAPENHFGRNPECGDQTCWGQGGGHDLEDEHDGREPDYH